MANMYEPISQRSIVVKSTNQVSVALGDERTILNLKNFVYYSLDPVGASVWNLLGEPRTVSKLRDSLLETYDVDAEQCERNLLVFLQEMCAEGLVDVCGDANSG
jgi:hypothetical protein